MARLLRFAVCATLLVIVWIRYFTETLGVLPRIANASDLPLTAGIASVILLLSITSRVPIRTAGTTPFLAVFAGAWFGSSLLNLDMVQVPAAVLFLGGHLLPILFAVSVFHADLGPDFGRLLVRTYLWACVAGLALAATQIQLVFSNPDALSLAFGANANQGALFLAFVLAIVIGRWFCGVAGPAEKALGMAAAPVFFLAGFKAMWVLFPIVVIGTLLAAGATDPRRLTRTIASAASIVVLSALIVLVVPLPELRYYAAFAHFDPATFGKVQIVQSTPAILTERAWAPLVGLGPGTMTSRAFRTFADLPNRGSSTDVTYELMPPTYRNKYSDRYVLPLVTMEEWQLSSGTLQWPFTSYVSLLLETGAFGFLGIIGIYLITWMRLLALARSARRPETRAAAVAGAIALGTLLAAAVLDNWLEQTRVATLAWLVVLIAWYEARQERGDSSALAPAGSPAPAP